MCGNIEAGLSLGDWLWDCRWLTDDQPCQCNKHTNADRHLDNAGDWNQLIADSTGDQYQPTAHNAGYRNEATADNIGDRYHLAAALGHNTAAVCCWWTRSILQRVCCSESCILYLFAFSFNNNLIY